MKCKFILHSKYAGITVIGVLFIFLPVFGYIFASVC